MVFYIICFALWIMVINSSPISKIVHVINNMVMGWILLLMLFLIVVLLFGTLFSFVLLSYDI